jgi:isohexenylglutaconyl-CoA hydratase
MTYETLIARRQGPALELTLNRPESRNAMSLAMVAELQQALAQAEQTVGSDDAVRVIVLRGAAGHFCSGGDLKDMAAARLRAMQGGCRRHRPDRRGQCALRPPVRRLLPNSPLAIVALLEGTVMGGGFGLACVADVAIATETASFRLPETSLGVVPAQIAPFLVERLGYSQAKRLAVTGGRLDAAAALRIGLVHQQVASGQLQAALDAVLADILACGPGALAATKALMAKARLQAPASLIDEAAAVFSRAAQGTGGHGRHGRIPAKAQTELGAGMKTSNDRMNAWRSLGGRAFCAGQGGGRAAAGGHGAKRSATQTYSEVLDV